MEATAVNLARAEFQCNVCGAWSSRPAKGFDRESGSCAHCDSSVRLRALIALLSQELFGVVIPLPEFPVLKGIRGLGMSDPPRIADLLAEKFDYTNTFYHQAPRFDVLHPEPGDLGRYDFVISSEVMEHVPPPVETGFANLYDILKPNGLLLLTVPFNLSVHAEHFPSLHEFDIASPGGSPVLVNRRPDGSVEVFDDLVFHGGPGSTVEMRHFRKGELLQLLSSIGFSSTRIASENRHQFGIEHALTWGFPIVARKGLVQIPVEELAASYYEAQFKARHFEAEYIRLRTDYDKFVEFHESSYAEATRELEARADWGRRLDREIADYRQHFHTLVQEHAAKEREIMDRCEAAERVQSNWWVRMLQNLGLVQ